MTSCIHDGTCTERENDPPADAERDQLLPVCVFHQNQRMTHNNEQSLRTRNGDVEPLGVVPKAVRLHLDLTDCYWAQRYSTDKNTCKSQEQIGR